MKNEFKKIGTNFRTETIAYYGPNDETVTKIIVGITVAAGRNFIETREWSSESKDIKNDKQVLEEIFAYSKS